MIVKNEKAHVVNLGGDFVIAPLQEIEVPKTHTDSAKRAIEAGYLVEVKSKK